MKNIRNLSRIVFLAAIMALGPTLLWAQQPAPQQAPLQAAVHAPVPAAQPPNAAPAPLNSLPLAPIATQMGQTLQNLVGTSSPLPAALAPDSGDDLGQISDTFATGILDTLAHAVDALKANSTNLEANLSALPDFSDWLARQSSDPHRQILWSAIESDFLIAVCVPALIGSGIWLLLLPLRLNLRQSMPQTKPGRVGLLASLFFLRIVPVFIYLGASLLLLDQNEIHRLPRFVILNVIYALGLGYTIRQVLRSLFAPSAPHLRMFAFSTPQALSAYKWFSAFNFVIVYGYFLLDVAGALRVPGSAIVVFQNIFALILTLMTIAVIFLTRARVAKILRGKEDGEEDAQSFGFAFRSWLSRHWHQWATFYLIVSLAITWLGINDGFALMLRGTILSTLILAAARFAFLALDVWITPKAGTSALPHRQFLAFMLRPVLWISAAIAIAEVWGMRFTVLVSTPAGQKIIGALASIALTLLILTSFYEMIHAAVERHLNRRDKTSKLPVASARARTLLPMLRNSIFILFCIIAGLICLSAVGVNVAPLLAGAGVVGVAIGFGSQTLVKDFLTGLFIVVENTVAVGDIIKIGDFSGVVESLSIRTIKLRDSDGSLHIIPFGEVTKLTNMTRGFAYALVDIDVSYDSDLERVMNVLRDVGAQIQEDPIFKRVITEPIEVMGVEKLGESSITIRARIRTRPGKQWDVKRLLLLRIKERFDKEKIEMPFPTVTHITKVAP